MLTTEPCVGRIVIVNNDLSWYVCVCGRQLISSTPTLSDLPQQISSFDQLTTLLQCVQSYSLCTGNPHCEFIELIEKEGGEFKSVDGKVVASLDKNEFTINGRTIDKTIRATDC